MVRCKSRSRPRGFCCIAPPNPCANSGGWTARGSREAPWVSQRLALSSICLRPTASGGDSCQSVGADLWILDVDRGVPSRLVSRPGMNVSPVWSPTAERFYLLPMPRPTCFARTPVEPAGNNASLNRRTLNFRWTGPATALQFSTRKITALATAVPMVSAGGAA